MMGLGWREGSKHSAFRVIPLPTVAAGMGTGPLQGWL